MLAISNKNYAEQKTEENNFIMQPLVFTTQRYTL